MTTKTAKITNKTIKIFFEESPFFLDAHYEDGFSPSILQIFFLNSAEST